MEISKRESPQDSVVGINWISRRHGIIPIQSGLIEKCASALSLLTSSDRRGRTTAAAEKISGSFVPTHFDRRIPRFAFRKRALKDLGIK
jgi:hypothetical protein